MPEDRTTLKPALPAAAGRDWLAAGLTIVRAQFLRLLLLGLVLQLIAGFSQSSILGLFFVLCVPVFSAGMLQAMHIAGQGNAPPFGTLFTGFRVRGSLGPLLLLGSIVLALTMAAMIFALAGVVANLDPELLGRLERGDASAVLDLDPGVIQRTLMGLLVGLLTGAMLTYFAVPLIWFRKDGLGRALALGLKGLARQWRPFLVLGLLLALVGLPVMMLTGFAVSAAALGNEPSLLVGFLTLLGAVFYQLLMFSTQYVAFRAVYDWDLGVGAQPTEKDNQLVA